MSDASIIISTKNRSANLRRALESIKEMDRPASIDLEIVVVDNGSIDDTRDVISSFLGEIPVIIIVEALPGKSRALNTGIRFSKGRIIMITDDDCIVAKDWLVNSIDLFSGDACILAGGRIDLFDPDDLPITILTSTTKRVLEDPDDVFSFIFGANMSFGRAVFEQIGGFDQRLGPGVATRAGEDIDYVYRAFRANIPVRYEPDIVVGHAHGRRDEVDRFRQISNYSIGEGALIAKYLVLGDPFIMKLRFRSYFHVLRKINHGRIYRKIAILRLKLIFGFYEFLRLRPKAAQSE